MEGLAYLFRKIKQKQIMQKLIILFELRIDKYKKYIYAVFQCNNFFKMKICIKWISDPIITFC